MAARSTAARRGAALAIAALAAATAFDASALRDCTDEEFGVLAKAELDRRRLRLAGRRPAALQRPSPDFVHILGALRGARKCGGFFVECGANNGVNSVTRPFEAMGWRGVPPPSGNRAHWSFERDDTRIPTLQESVKIGLVRPRSGRCPQACVEAHPELFGYLQKRRPKCDASATGVANSKMRCLRALPVSA